jgi:voltage-gated potassium channel
MNRGMKNRMLKALSAVIIMITLGTIGFWFLADDGVTIGQCLYMTIITLSTVGYGEVIPLDDAGRVFASFIIIIGMGSLIYFGSTMVAIWVELDMQEVRRRKRMQKSINNLSGHAIVCGVGTTGAHVVRELIAVQTPFVMIDSSLQRIDELLASVDGKVEDILFIQGDATEERILQRAGIDRAQSLVAALRSDKDNLYIILSARQMNGKVKIVARATEKNVPSMMLHAGANRVVSPNYIGGMRIASEIIRPQVVEFLDVMLKDTDQATRIEQVSLPPDSPLVGMRLSDTKIRQSADVLVIAMRDRTGKYIYNPGPETMLTEQSTLVVLGALDSVIKLRDSLAKSQDSVVLIDPPSKK